MTVPTLAAMAKPTLNTRLNCGLASVAAPFSDSATTARALLMPGMMTQETAA
jgi:hypothetical protein